MSLIFDLKVSVTLILKMKVGKFELADPEKFLSGLQALGIVLNRQKIAEVTAADKFVPTIVRH